VCRRTAKTTDPHASLCLKFVAQAFDSMYARYLCRISCNA